MSGLLPIHFHTKRTLLIGQGGVLSAASAGKQGAKDELECQLGAIESGGSLEITVAVRIDKLASVASSVPIWHYRAWDPDRYAYSGHTAIQHCH